MRGQACLSVRPWANVHSGESDRFAPPPLSDACISCAPVYFTLSLRDLHLTRMAFCVSRRTEPSLVFFYETWLIDRRDLCTRKRAARAWRMATRPLPKSDQVALGFLTRVAVRATQVRVPTRSSLIPTSEGLHQKGLRGAGACQVGYQHDRATMCCTPVASSTEKEQNCNRCSPNR